MKELKDYIIIMNNIMPPPVADAVLAEYKNCADWVPAITANGKSDGDRQCSTVGISFDVVIKKNQETRQKIDKMIFPIAGQAIKEYTRHFNHTNIEQDTGYELLKYETGQFYTTHTDSFKERPRAVSCSFALNDDYEGGEFAFFDRELVYNLKKGSCIMFPSNFMYPHEIMPVTSGTRYSIVTWFI